MYFIIDKTCNLCPVKMKRGKMGPGKFISLMTTIIIPVLLITAGYTRQYDCTRDYPVFDYRAEGNSLPWGEYVMVRSFRDTTQIIICRNHYQFTIYTDRNNLKEGDIIASSYSDLDHTITSPAVPSQWEFDSMLKSYIMNGASGGGMELFQGISYYLDKIGSEGTTVNKISGEYMVKVDDSGTLTEVIVDPRWKKLVIRRVNSDSEASRCPSVYIDQTLDKNLSRIITDFAYHLRKGK